jgi:hypothetical protein
VLERAGAPGVLSGHLAFYDAKPTAKDARLTATGTVTGGRLQFRGIGVKGTSAEGWVYDRAGMAERRQSASLADWLSGPRGAASLR